VVVGAEPSFGLDHDTDDIQLRTYGAYGLVTIEDWPGQSPKLISIDNPSVFWSAAKLVGNVPLDVARAIENGLSSDPAQQGLVNLAVYHYAWALQTSRKFAEEIQDGLSDRARLRADYIRRRAAHDRPALGDDKGMRSWAADVGRALTGAPTPLFLLVKYERVLLRVSMPWLVCAAAAFMAYKAWTYREAWGTWTFGTLAFLFNPFVPSRGSLAEDEWVVLSALALGLFILGAVFLRKPGPATGPLPG
jgi:hypothetical protein